MPQNTPPPIKSLPRRWLTVKAGTYTIPPSESGLGYTNAGATGPTTFVLPKAWQGRNFAFFNAAGHQITIERAPSSSDQINVNESLNTSINDGGVQGAYVELDAPGELFWLANASKSFGGAGGGLPVVTGSFADVHSTVIPMVVGYILFDVEIYNVFQSDNGTIGMAASPSLDGSNPVTGNVYDWSYNGDSNVADVGFFTFFIQASSPPRPSMMQFRCFAGGASQKLHFAGSQYTDANAAVSAGGIGGSLDTAGLMQSLILTCRTVGALTSGEWRVQALQ